MTTKVSMSKKSLIIMAGLIALAIGWRLFNHQYGVAYNLELVTMVSVIAVLKFGWRAGLIVPLSVMAISDAVIGNTSILVFTWLSFALIGLAAVTLRQLNNRPNLQITSGVLFAALSSIAFFLITNFGVWLQGYYPPTLDGLITSYAMGIPFYKNMLIGNLIFIPTAITAWQMHRSVETVKLSDKCKA